MDKGRLFLEKLIVDTQNGILQWDKVPKKKWDDIKSVQGDITGAYSTSDNERFGDDVLVAIIQRKYSIISEDGDTYERVDVYINIMNKQYDNLYQIFDDDIDTIAATSELFRLYKLIQRSANKIDNIIERYLKK